MLGAQVTFRSQEVQARGICDAIAELGFGAEVKETRSAQQERCVARLQVLALLCPSLIGLTLQVAC